jgi:hypothetical protein
MTEIKLPWQPIEEYPLILAGPILRKTQAEAVTVWIALKQASEVTLTVYSTQAEGKTVAAPILQGSSSTVRVGKFLHIAVITAVSTITPLQPGQIYAYDVSFESPQANLTTVLGKEETISYFAHGLPTFSLPPDDLDALQIVHGSCRKVHGGGKDALPILDELIAQRVTQPNARPHQLFLTGDQVYADDVPDPFLWAVTALGNALLGWEEFLPIRESSKGVESQPVSDFAPGQRTEVAEKLGGLTAMLDNKPEKAKSHLFSFGEYCSAYLLVWSSVLFPQDFPPSHFITQNRQQQKTWNQELEKVKAFGKTLWQVRRVLANIPTYTICDDHDVTDDWYLNREWCDRVLSKPLGRRIIQNALLAYALFQGWGNTPAQFAPKQPGAILLDAAQAWSASQGKDHHASQTLRDYLGIPPQDPKTGLPKLRIDQDILVLDRHSQALKWHYSVQMPAYEFLVLDTRTWRGYPPGEGEGLMPPRLLSPTAFAEQIDSPLKTTPAKVATLVVLPTNLVSLKIIDIFQERDLAKGKVFNSDVGDSWNLNPVALSQLLQSLFARRDRVIILSGDIHYACAVRLNCWFHHPSGVRPTVLAQLTASGFKNAELKTYIAHTKLKSLIPEPTEHWVGWHSPPELLKVVATPYKIEPRPISLPSPHSVLYPLHQSAGNDCLNWEPALPHPKTSPDLQYTIEWIPRQPACNVQPEDQPQSESQRPKLIPFWRTRWLQEGTEIVGHNNVSIVHFQQSGDQLTAIQDVYWRANWYPQPLVYSRYEVPLTLPDSPPLLPPTSPSVSYIKSS